MATNNSFRILFNKNSNNNNKKLYFCFKAARFSVLISYTFHQRYIYIYSLYFNYKSFEMEKFIYTFLIIHCYLTSH